MMRRKAASMLLTIFHFQQSNTGMVDCLRVPIVGAGEKVSSRLHVDRQSEWKLRKAAVDGEKLVLGEDEVLEEVEGGCSQVVD